jgi:molybdopterin-guanine dinucleotide biosynthesis protein B
VSTIKHAHSEFEIDKPGKDSYVHRVAGATEVLVSSARRWALIHELREAQEPSLSELLAHLGQVDLVLVEGFKRDMHPKLEVHRAVVGKPLLQPHDPHIVGVASDMELDLPVPCLRLDDIPSIAEFVQKHAVPPSRMDSHGAA